MTPSIFKLVKMWEEEILRYWSERDIYEKVKGRYENKPLFRFLDGPPYPTGPIHLGHSWNKTLKDIVLRFWRMRGYAVVDTPGYDMHGLPIEVQVEKKLGFRSKRDIIKYGVDRFVEECKKLALENAKIETAQFQRLGVWMDWDRPYMTIHPSYVEGIWWTIKIMAEKGRLYRGWKVLGWCPRCQTVLAQHEYEYKTKKSPSMYFKVKLSGDEARYITVWTTTPWTLVGNMLIAVNPNEYYVEVIVPEGEHWILAETLYKQGLLRELGVEKTEVVRRFKGIELEGLKYEHPLLDEVPIHKEFRAEYENYNSIVTSEEYVSVEEGTGCLHTAPSFGPEDYELGLKYKLPLVQFIDERAIFKDEGGIFKGLTVNDASDRVVELLEKKGLLIKLDSIMHEYPHCWRCKTPLVFRLTRQWFFRVKDLRDKLINEAQKTEWTPAWAKNLFVSWLSNIDDWCISRQRFWGTPLPIWVCERCENYYVIGSISELEALSGNCVEEIHRPAIDEVTLPCRKCGGTMRRVGDVVDVWVDSGSAIWAVLPQIGKEDFRDWETLDFILEGKDQIRGWFSALFVLSVALFDKLPFKRVYMHGFVTDEKGMAMHKSLGNVIAPEEVIEKVGAEVLRFYQVISTSPGEDQKFGYSLLRKGETYVNIVINTYNYLDQIATYYAKGEVNRELRAEDLWLISKTNTLIKRVTGELESYDLPGYARSLYDFIVEDVSHFYIQAVRERIRNEEEAGKVLYVLRYVLERFLKLMCPLNPMLAERIYLQYMKRLMHAEAESVHMLPWPEVEESKIDAELERKMEVIREIVTGVKHLKQSAGIKARWPCKTLYVPSKELEGLEELIARVTNVKNVVFDVPPDIDIIKKLETSIGPIGLDLTETREIRAERLMRDLARYIRATRKKMGLKPRDLVIIELSGDSELIHLLRGVMEELKIRAGAEEVKILNKIEEAQGTVKFNGGYVKFVIRRESQ